MGYTQDPEYAYLFNALGILNLQVPYHVDHPGTTMQVLSALLIVIRYLLTLKPLTLQSLNLDVLANPERYLDWIASIITLMLCISYWLAGFIIYRFSNRLWKAILFQATPFFFPTILFSIHRVSTETLMLILVVWISVLIVPTIFIENFNFSWRRSMLMGVLIGAALVTKVIALPLLLLLLLPRKTKNVALGVLSTIISVVFFSLPIVSQYGRMVAWFQQLIFHTGIHGVGATFLPVFRDLKESFSKLLIQDPYIYFLIVLLGISSLNGFFIIINKRGISKSYTFKLFESVLILVVILFQMSMTLRAPNSRYLLPSMGLSGLGALLYYEIQFDTLKNGYLHKAFTKYSLLIISVIGLASSFVWGSAQSDLAKIEKENTQWISQLINSENKNCTIVYSYPASSLLFALESGNYFTREYFGKQLDNLNPNSYFYIIWEYSFYDFYGKISTEKIVDKLISGDCVLLQGSEINNNELTGVFKDFLFLRLDHNRNQALYKIILK